MVQLEGIDTEMGLNPSSFKQVPAEAAAKPESIAEITTTCAPCSGADLAVSPPSAQRPNQDLSPSVVHPLFERLVAERAKFWDTLFAVPFVQDSWIEAIKQVSSGDLRAGRSLFFRKKLSPTEASAFLRSTRPAMSRLRTTECPKTRELLRREIASILTTVPMNPEYGLTFARAVLDKCEILTTLHQESHAVGPGCGQANAASLVAEKKRKLLEDELGRDVASAHLLGAELQGSRDNYINARDLLYQKSAHLVNRYKNWKLHEGGDSTDLLQEGGIGLLRAIERFHPDTGASFPVVARAIMNHTLHNFFRSKRSVVKVRPELRAVVRAAREGVPDETNNRFLRLHEVAERMGFSSEVATPLGYLVAPLRPLDWAQDDNAVAPYLQERPHSPLEVAARAETVAHLRQTLATLPEDVQRAVSLKFGIETTEEKTLREIGDILGCSEPTACRLVHRGLSMLRRRMPE